MIIRIPSEQVQDLGPDMVKQFLLSKGMDLQGPIYQSLAMDRFENIYSQPDPINAVTIPWKPSMNWIQKWYPNFSCQTLLRPEIVSFLYPPSINQTDDIVFKSEILPLRALCL